MKKGIHLKKHSILIVLKTSATFKQNPAEKCNNITKTIRAQLTRGNTTIVEDHTKTSYNLKIPKDPSGFQASTTEEFRGLPKTRKVY